MSQIAIDPIGYSNALQKAGMPKEQADIIARTQEASFDKLIEARELATKDDLQVMEYRLLARMQENRVNLIRWMIGLIAGLGAFLVAVMAWLR